jgi:hypothetical protein
MLNLETSKDGKSPNNNGLGRVVLAVLKGIATFVGEGAKYGGDFIADIPIERHFYAATAKN